MWQNELEYGTSIKRLLPDQLDPVSLISDKAALGLAYVFYQFYIFIFVLGPRNAELRMRKQSITSCGAYNITTLVIHSLVLSTKSMYRSALYQANLERFHWLIWHRSTYGSCVSGQSMKHLIRRCHLWSSAIV